MQNEHRGQPYESGLVSPHYEACAHWRDAPICSRPSRRDWITHWAGNDASIDCAKSSSKFLSPLRDELDRRPARQTTEATQSFSAWSVRQCVCSVGRKPERQILKLVSPQHHKLTTALGDLRTNRDRSATDRDGFSLNMSVHHRARRSCRRMRGDVSCTRPDLEAKRDRVFARAVGTVRAFNQLIDANVGLSW
jgi:hypothetical protein